MQILIEHQQGLCAGAHPVEIVERKGLGHQVGALRRFGPCGLKTAAAKLALQT